jgi:hypothetical protein
VAKEVSKSKVMHGPANATHLWQPVDHNVGAAYHRRMGLLYDNWMLSPAADAYCATGIPVDVRRVLLTQWAGEVYRELEVERELAESKGEQSIFHKSFLRTGCLVSANGEHDKEIRIDEVEKLFPNFYTSLGSVESHKKAPKTQDSFIIELSSDESGSELEDDADVEDEMPEDEMPDEISDQEVDSEDIDDESGSEQEPLPNDLSLDVLAIASDDEGKEARQGSMARVLASERMRSWVALPSQAPADDVERQFEENARKLTGKRNRRPAFRDPFAVYSDQIYKDGEGKHEKIKPKTKPKLKPPPKPKLKGAPKAVSKAPAKSKPKAKPKPKVKPKPKAKAKPKAILIKPN